MAVTVLSLAILLLAAVLLLAMRSAMRRRRAALAAALTEARQLATSAQATTEALAAALEALRHQVEQLEHRQERLATTGSHSGFRQAIALCRHGASARELVESCGLSEGEARLVESLYGKAAAARLQEADLH